MLSEATEAAANRAADTAAAAGEVAASAAAVASSVAGDAAATATATVGSVAAAMPETVEKISNFAATLPETLPALADQAATYAKGLPDATTAFVQSVPEKIANIDVDPEAIKAGAISTAKAAKEKFDAIDFCTVSDTLNTIIADLTTSAQGVQYDKLHEHVFAGTFAAASLMAVGGALLLAPVLFGRDWINTVKTIVAFCFGVVGSSMLLQKEGLDLFDKGADSLGLMGEGRCMLSVGIMAGIAITCACYAQRLFSYAMFCVGAVAVGYGALFGTSYVIPLVPSQYAMYTESNYINAACAVLGVGGGLIIVYAGNSFINLVLGAAGAVLVAQGAVTVLLTDFITAELNAKLMITQYYAFYVAGLAVILYALRSAGVCFREGDPEPRDQGGLRRQMPPSRNGRPGGYKVAPANPPGKRGSPGAKRMY